MLEVLHSLANQSTPLRHGVIFLFNGAEENILQVKVYRRFTLHTLHSFGLSLSADLSLSFCLSSLSIRPATASLPSIPGPNRCEPSLTWKLQVSAARKSFSRQVHGLHFVKDYIWDANHSGMFVSASLPVCVSCRFF